MFCFVLFLSFQDSARKSWNILSAPWWYQRMIRWHSPFCYIPSGVFATLVPGNRKKKQSIFHGWKWWSGSLPSFMNIMMWWNSSTDVVNCIQLISNPFKKWMFFGVPVLKPLPLLLGTCMFATIAAVLWILFSSGDTFPALPKRATT